MTPLTRQHFALIAESLKSTRPDDALASDTSYQQWDLTVRCLAASLASTNRAFDRERFFAACGLTP